MYAMNIEINELKYLELGHTEIECDSMDAAKEHTKKNISTPAFGAQLYIWHVARNNILLCP